MMKKAEKVWVPLVPQRMDIDEKYRRLGEAVMREYYSHGEKEITVTITDESILEYLHVCVDVHPTTIVTFTERDQEMMKK